MASRMSSQIMKMPGEVRQHSRRAEQLLSSKKRMRSQSEIFGVPIPGSEKPFVYVTGSPKGSEGVMYNPAMRRDSLKDLF